MCVCVCVFVSVCDSSSETGDEWAFSLGTAGAIFSTGLYNGTGGGVLWKYIDDKKNLREHKTNSSATQSASQALRAHRDRFLRA